MRRIGVILNPIAGMGGRVGLKGTDGMVEEARRLGAEPRAPDRAVAAVAALYERNPDVTILTCGDPMGESEVRTAGVEPSIVYRPDSTETSAADTRAAVERMVEESVDLILFVGGDGTAVDVATTLEELDEKVPILGVPAGVKIFSAVFAVTPETAGRIAAGFDTTEPREVNDIDEEAYREGRVESRIMGVVEVPVAEDLQSSKQLAGGTVEGLALAVSDDVEPGVTYILGPGGTLGRIKEALGFSGTPLGVDVWRDGEVIARDAAEGDILDALGERNIIVVSPIGGQGFIFGRGNHQISPAVIRQSEVEVVASRSKLDTVGVLRVDTGDPALDEELRGWIKVRVGRFERRMMQIV